MWYCNSGFFRSQNGFLISCPLYTFQKNNITSWSCSFICMCPPTSPIQKLVGWLVDTTTKIITKIINKRNTYCTLCMFGPCLKSSALCISPCTSSYPGQESWTKDRIRTLSWQQCQWFKQGWTSWTLVDRNQVILSKIFAAFDEMQRLQYSKHLKTATGQQTAPSTKSVFNWCNLQPSFLYRHMPIWPITWKSAAQITIPKGIPPACVIQLYRLDESVQHPSKPHTECRYVDYKLTNHANPLYPYGIEQP